MGQHADDILNGDVDEQTGEWLGDGDGFPRTLEPGQYNSFKGKTLFQHKDGRITNEDHDPLNYIKGTKGIRKELAILIKETIKENPEENENNIVNRCRKTMNDKYGKGWREQF